MTGFVFLLLQFDNKILNKVKEIFPLVSWYG